MGVKDKGEVLQEYLSKEENKGKSNAQLARELISKYPKHFRYDDPENLRRRVSRSKEKITVESVKVSVVDDRKYQVIEGNYLWKSAHGNINLAVEFIDQLFYEYSEHGLNLSQTEIINKHNLKVWEWNSIKSTLFLFKKSNIFSPHTVANTPSGELEEMISSKIKTMLDNTGYQVEKQYGKELNKKYREVIKKQTLSDVTLQTMILEISDVFPDCSIKPCIRVNNDGEGTVNIFLFDIHFGAQNRTKHIPLYSPEIVKEILLQIAEVINGLNAKEVNIFFGGDMIETFTGLNHIDSWKGIAKGYYGAKLVIELYKLLVEFLSQINNLKAVFAVPGNHDRATEKKDVDGEGAIAEILFEMVKLSFKDKLNVVYDEKIVSVSIDGIHYIMTHGHFKLTDSNPAELVLKHGDQYKFNLLVSGHWHERRIKKDRELFRQIVCPPLFPGNDYSVNLGYDASPGFLMVKNNGVSNKPIVIDYTL